MGVAQGAQSYADAEVRDDDDESNGLLFGTKPILHELGDARTGIDWKQWSKSEKLKSR